MQSGRNIYILLKKQTKKGSLQNDEDMNGEEVVSLATNFVKDRTILGSQHHSQKGNRNHKTPQVVLKLSWGTVLGIFSTKKGSLSSYALRTNCDSLLGMNSGNCSF